MALSDVKRALRQLLADDDSAAVETASSTGAGRSSRGHVGARHQQKAGTAETSVQRQRQSGQVLGILLRVVPILVVGAAVTTLARGFLPRKVLTLPGQGCRFLQRRASGVARRLRDLVQRDRHVKAAVLDVEASSNQGRSPSTERGAVGDCHAAYVQQWPHATMLAACTVAPNYACKLLRLLVSHAWVHRRDPIASQHMRLGVLFPVWRSSRESWTWKWLPWQVW